MEELINEFKELCMNLSINNDFISGLTIKEFFDKYAELKSRALIDSVTNDLIELEKRIDDALNSETNESLSEWLKTKRGEDG